MVNNNLDYKNKLSSPHPPYNPAICQYDYKLFLTMSYFINNKYINCTILKRSFLQIKEPMNLERKILIVFTILLNI